MMNFLCGPNGVLSAGVGVGAAAGFIWGMFDPRFPYPYGKFLIALGATIGAALAGILFFPLAC